MKISLGATLKSKCRCGFVPVVLAIISLAVSCSTGDRQTRSDSTGSPKGSPYFESKSVENRILREFRHWQGTRHKMGGNSSKGVDCSGFVRQIYWDAFKIELPRTTREQIKSGKTVSRGELQPGDLVFFKPPGYPRHVGIYLSNSDFIHASKTKGVTMSTIDAHYWGKYYWTARRVLAVSETR